MPDTRYWEASATLETLMHVLAGDPEHNIIQNYQRDPRSNRVRFWPPSQSVYNFLKEKLPSDTPILDDKYEEAHALKKATPVVHTKKKMGMSISDD